MCVFACGKAGGGGGGGGGGPLERFFVYYGSLNATEKRTISRQIW